MTKRPVIVTTWATVRTGDVMVTSNGDEWEVWQISHELPGPHIYIRNLATGTETDREVSADQRVRIVDRISEAAAEAGVSADQVASGVLASSGLLDGAEVVAPDPHTAPLGSGGAILKQCGTCFALVYPDRAAAHIQWHDGGSRR